MNKNVLLALCAVLALGLGATLYLAGDPHAGTAASADASQAASPGRSSALEASDSAELQRPEGLSLSSESDDPSTRVERNDTSDAAPTVALDVRVVFPADLPSDESASVEVEFPSSGAASTRKLSSALDAEGRARLELPGDAIVGTLKLKARYMFLEHDVALAPPFEAQTLEPLLGGCLVATLDLPPLSADVRLDEAPPFDAQLRGISMGSGMSHSTSSPVENRRTVVFGGLRPKLSYFLSIDTQVLAPVMDLELTFSPGQRVERNYTVKLGGTVRGVVLGPGDAPVVGAKVTPDARMNWLFGAARALTTDERGAFVLRGMPEGKLRIVARHSEYLEARSDELNLVDGGTTDVVLRLTEGESVAGVVTWPDGRPAAGADVNCSPADDAGGFMRSAKTNVLADADGRFQFRALSAKQVRLIVTAVPDEEAGGATTAPEWFARNDSVDTGTTVKLVLAPPHAVPGHVVSVGGEPIQKFTISNAWKGTGTTDIAAANVESADGSFTLHLPAGEHVLTVSADGFEAAPADGSWTVEIPLTGADLKLEMRRLAGVSGVVRDPNGQTVAGAKVELRGPRGNGFRRASSSDLTDVEGRFELSNVSAGVAKLVASADGFAPSEETPVEVVAGQAVERVELALRIGGRIEGVIYDSTGAPEPGRQIMVGAFGPGMGSPSGQTTSDAAGAFVIEHVAPGKQSVLAIPRMSSVAGGDQAALMAALRMTSVEVIDGATTHVTLGAPTATPVRLWGRVTRAGEPLSEGMITAIADGGSLLEGMKFASLKDDGTYEITLDKPGAYTLVVGRRMGDESSAEFFETIPETPEHHLDLALPIGGIRGRVVSNDGAPVAGVQVRYQVEGRSSLAMFDMSRGARSDADGRFELPYLPAGVYTLRAGGPEMFGAQKTKWSTCVRTGLAVQADRMLEGVELRLEAAATITGIVRDASNQPVSEASVFVCDANGVLLNPMSSTLTDGQGRFRFEGASPGSYTVSARTGALTSPEVGPVVVGAGDANPVELRLAAGTIVTVEVTSDEPLGRVDIRVLDDAGREQSGRMSMESLQSLMTEGVASSRHRVGPLPPGKYRVLVTPDGGETETKPLSLSGQPERTLKVKLRSK